MKPWPKDSAKRTAYVDRVFERVAPRYDALTGLLSWGQDGRWKARVLSLLPPAPENPRVLDLATGTGAFPLLLRRSGHRGLIVGIDRSRAMLDRARSKRAALPGVHLVRGELNALPVAPRSFDVILMGYGLRYLDDLGAALADVRGALRPGGTLVTLDFGLPEAGWYRALCLSYLFVFGTLWGLALHGRPDTYWHIVESLRAFPGQRALARLLEEVGYGPIVVIEDLGGISVTIAAGAGADDGRGARRPEA
jgi:demethylmenaquinone methyltransferase/2-methoxy-6-polyprenyl-1,4-benzoquinol methylase